MSSPTLVGLVLGLRVGAFDGLNEGTGVGCLLGRSVGAGVGALVGRQLGAPLGRLIHSQNSLLSPDSHGCMWACIKGEAQRA